MEIRTFIAVDIPQNIKMELDKLIVGLRSLAPDIRWVRASNLHITLRFLGEIPQDSIASLEKSIEESIKDTNKFNISLTGIGGFPNLRRPRVIWVGVGDGNEKLMELADRVESACRSAGFGQADKPFSSHLTIGRVKYPGGLERLISNIEKSDFSTASFEIPEAIIFKSDLLPSGPKYTRMAAISLKS